ncbi:hypothetical protein NHX12_004200 [Muraenolepis orangiensis]|uniref:Uncharacterized protein n=1 Tax=Muraenolepis orangiensis TaxID=630683 RepID=A0A9Q0IDY1_9TELE|nr:hypothetical protein NHX12_004200 [Muraenolepis orangiensis]
MSFLSGSHVQQPAVANHHGGGSSHAGYPPPSAGHQLPDPGLTAAHRPAATPLPSLTPCRTPPPPPPPPPLHAETPHRASTEVKVGSDAGEGGPRITLTGEGWIMGPSGKEGPSGPPGLSEAARPSIAAVASKTERAGLGGGGGEGGAERENGSGGLGVVGGMGCGGSGLLLGSAGQSPSSPLSLSSPSLFSPTASSSSSSSGPSPDVWPGKPLLPSRVDVGVFLSGAPRPGPGNTERGEENQPPSSSSVGQRPGGHRNTDPGVRHPSLGSLGFQNAGGPDVHPAGRTEPVVGRCASGPPRDALPQRSIVRRAMSDCSHLAVPSLSLASSYPSAGNGGPANSPGASPWSGPPRPHPPHVALARRSFTVSDERGGGAFQLMTTAAVPSSPPPRRHDGSFETGVLLPVPPSLVPPLGGFHGDRPSVAGR